MRKGKKKVAFLFFKYVIKRHVNIGVRVNIYGT